MFHSGEGSQEFTRASWSEKPEEPKISELAAEKQLPCETARETCAEGSGCTSVGTSAKADLAEMKAESIWGDQEKSLGSPCRASVRGWRIRAAP